MTQHDAITEIAQMWVDGLAAQEARTPSEAARASGCKTDEEIYAWVTAWVQGRGIPAGWAAWVADNLRDQSAA